MYGPEEQQLTEGAKVNEITNQWMVMGEGAEVRRSCGIVRFSACEAVLVITDSSDLSE